MQDELAMTPSLIGIIKFPPRVR